jgi:hypothetical protein
MPISYASDIRPLFRSRDITAMRKKFDLSSYQDVSANADKILSNLAAGQMPCDGAWPADDIAKFRQWIEEGKAP